MPLLIVLQRTQRAPPYRPRREVCDKLLAGRVSRLRNEPCNDTDGSRRAASDRRAMGRIRRDANRLVNRHWLNTVRTERNALRGAPEDPSASSTPVDLHSTDKRTDGAANVVLEVYRLVSIERTSAPVRGVGDNWLVYRIARGGNVVTGYRRGTRASVTVDIEKVVAAMNERLFIRPRRVQIKLGKAAPPSAPEQVRDKDPV